ncbi:MAG: DMT family transporter [Thermovirga sp.]|nr:DMT family transporter [Thermovirga sp.]
MALHESPSKITILSVLFIGIIGISTGSIFAKYAEAPSLIISTYRTGIAAAFMAPIALIYYRQELLSIKQKDLIYVFLAGLFLALHFATWITSLFYTSVASSVVIVETIPIWTALLSPLVTKDRTSLLSWLGIGLSFIGMIIITTGDFSIGKKALIGDLLALAGAWFGTFYFLAGRVVRPRMGLPSYTFICYGAAFAILLSTSLILGLPLRGFSTRTWWAFAGMGLVSQIIGHSSYNWALKHVSAGLVAVALLGEPLGATFLAWLLFHESLTIAKIIGGTAILTGIIIAARGENS